MKNDFFSISLSSILSLFVYSEPKDFFKTYVIKIPMWEIQQFENKV